MKRISPVRILPDDLSCVSRSSFKPRIRIVDYVAFPGGGARVIGEIIRGFKTLGSPVGFEIVTYGDGVERFESLL